MECDGIDNSMHYQIDTVNLENVSENSLSSLEDYTFTVFKGNKIVWTVSVLTPVDKRTYRNDDDIDDNINDYIKSYWHRML